MDERRTVVGLTGSFGAGCTMVAEHLKNQSWRYYSLSDIMRDIYPKYNFDEVEKQKLRGAENRQYQQDIGNWIRQRDGAALARQAVMLIQEGEKSGVPGIVIDSIRNPSEIAYLRNAFSNFFLLAIWASRETRWKRVRENYKGNRDLFEEDDLRDSGEHEPSWGKRSNFA